MRRDRSSPVWVRVIKGAGEEGGDVVGEVQYLVRHNRCKKKWSEGGWRAVLDNPSDPTQGGLRSRHYRREAPAVGPTVAGVWRWDGESRSAAAEGRATDRGGWIS